MADRRGGLTLKQVLFTEHYIGDAKGNGTEAARMAGYGGEAATLAQIACENLKRPEIAARIAERVGVSAMTTDEILLELSAIGRAQWGAFVQEITNHRGEVVDVRMPLTDKLKALELLGKYHKMFTQQVEVSEPVQKALIGVDLDRI